MLAFPTPWTPNLGQYTTGCMSAARSHPYSPLTDRKHRLRSVIPGASDRLLYCDHVHHDGEKLFELACSHDLEGIVAKRKSDPYLEGHASWLKIRNRNYSQWVGREDLASRERMYRVNGEVVSGFPGLHRAILSRPDIWPQNWGVDGVYLPCGLIEQVGIEKVEA